MGPAATTEEFPYTARYVSEMLQVDENQLLAFCKALSISPRRDEQTESVVFNHRELELLRKAVELAGRGDDLQTIAQKLNAIRTEQAGISSHPMATATGMAAPAPVQRGHVSAPAHPGTAMATAKEGQQNLAYIVETVSQAKESILRDLSKLLDDKLAGLDEVVVELIRCKSENDSLRQKLSAALKEKEDLRLELGRFKPVQFGFFRKVGK
jgi:hypothetical protein